jgi:hypothetical protein
MKLADVGGLYTAWAANRQPALAVFQRAGAGRTMALADYFLRVTAREEPARFSLIYNMIL